MAFLAPLVREWFDLDLKFERVHGLADPRRNDRACDLQHGRRRAVQRSQNLREASLALGATRAETIFKAVIPAAKNGLAGSVLMGFGRAIGETMVVLMVAGGAARIPEFHL